jgi:hypothetical protein
MIELQQKYEREKQQRIIEGNEKDRERILEIQKLRNEHVVQLKKTRANLMAMNEETLQNSAKIVIMQNA